MEGAVCAVRRRLVALSVVAVLGSGVSACGGGDGDAAAGSQEEQVRAVLERLGAALADEDGATACELMTPAGRNVIAGAAAVLPGGSEQGDDHTCESAIELVFETGPSEDFDPEITAVTVEGDEASATATMAHDSAPQTARLERIDGEWRVLTWFTN